MPQNLDTLVRELASRRGLNPDTGDEFEQAHVASARNAVETFVDGILATMPSPSRLRWLSVYLTAWGQQVLTEPPNSESRRFHLQRDHDVTGASGTGHVADGILWPDGTVAMRWRHQHASTVVWSNIDDAITVHGHDGATRIVWDD